MEKNVDYIEQDITKEKLNGEIPKANEMQEDELDIVEIIKKLWRNRLLIIIVTVFFMALGVIYALRATPMFNSTLSMYAANGEGKKGGFRTMAALMGMGSSMSVNNYNISDVVNSRKIAKELIFHKWNTKSSKEKKNLLAIWGIKGGNKDVVLHKAIKKCTRMISISSDDETGLMELSVMSIDPVLSAEMANYLGEAVTKYIQEHVGESLENNLGHINTRLAQVKEELIEKELALKTYKEKNRDINSATAQLEIARLMREVEIKQGVYLTLNQEKELAMIEKIKTKPVINILDKAEVPVFKAKPSGAKICIGFTFFGGIIGVALVLLLPFLAENFGEFKLSRMIK